MLCATVHLERIFILNFCFFPFGLLPVPMHEHKQGGDTPAAKRAGWRRRNVDAAGIDSYELVRCSSHVDRLKFFLWSHFADCVLCSWTLDDLFGSCLHVHFLNICARLLVRRIPIGTIHGTMCCIGMCGKRVLAWNPVGRKRLQERVLSALVRDLAHRHALLRKVGEGPCSLVAKRSRFASTLRETARTMNHRSSNSRTVLVATC